MTEQVERDGYDQFWDVVESAPVHHGHIVQPIDALRSAWLVRDLTEDDFRAARAAIASLTVTPQRCAECDCENGGDECTWIAPAKPAVTPQEAAKVLWDMLQLSDGIPKIDQDAAQALWDRVQGAGGFYAVNEFLAELAGIDTGEDSQ